MKIDVLVVGAGPAGSAAAILLREQGHSVVIVDSVAFPRERPGETLHPGIESLFQRLGIAESIRHGDFLRHAAIQFAYGAGKVKEVLYTPEKLASSECWLGYQIPRIELDTILLNRAQALGTRVLHAKAQSICFNGDRIENVNLQESSSGAAFKSIRILFLTLRDPRVGYHGRWKSQAVSNHVHSLPATDMLQVQPRSFSDFRIRSSYHETLAGLGLLRSIRSKLLG